MLMSVRSRIVSRLKMAERSFATGITKFKRMSKTGVTESLGIIRTILFCLGTRFTFLIAGRGTTNMLIGAIFGEDAVTRFRRVNDGMLL